MKCEKIIFGIGTGRCGTMSLAQLLNEQDDSFITHEGKSDERSKYHNKKFRNKCSVLPWTFNEEKFNKMWKAISSREYDVSGDVSFYWLQYVERILEIYPTAKFIGLIRNKDEVIASYAKKTKGRNHWMPYNDSSGWIPDNEWDKCYPKFDVESKQEAIGLYYDLYNKTMLKFEEKYPENVRCFAMDYLNDEDGVMEILEFCDFDDPYVVTGIKSNQKPQKGFLDEKIEKSKRYNNTIKKGVRKRLLKKIKKMSKEGKIITEATKNKIAINLEFKIAKKVKRAMRRMIMKRLRRRKKA